MHSSDLKLQKKMRLRFIFVQRLMFLINFRNNDFFISKLQFYRYFKTNARATPSESFTFILLKIFFRNLSTVLRISGLLLLHSIVPFFRRI